jgi:catechol 2,3-dioxygenase-like lactoylglutathione lyase family enzyme
VRVNHIGVTVGDLDRAVCFYRDVFGLDVLVGPERARAGHAGTERRADIFGTRWGEMRIAHLADENGTGVELFEFVQPPVEYPVEHFEFWRVGFSHLSFTVDDLESMRAAIEAHGGATRTAVYELQPGCRICYCKDPWGNAIELSSGAYPETHPST